MATKVWGKGDYKLKIEKRIIKVRSWKESLEKLIKARDNEKDFVSEALSSGRGSGRQPSQHSGLRVYLNLKVESAETQKLYSLMADIHSSSFLQQQSKT